LDNRFYIIQFLLVNESFILYLINDFLIYLFNAKIFWCKIHKNISENEIDSMTELKLTYVEIFSEM